jgi:RNA polymerase sigma-70 factor (ECF subfamily)
MDEREFDELFASSYARLVSQLYAMIGDRDEAEECVQEAFARAWQHRRSLDRSGRPEAWLRTTAYRLAVSRWRRVLLARRSPDRALAPSARTEPSDERLALVTALRQLPESQRRAVVLHYIADLTVADVAREIGIADGTVKGYLSRGRATLAGLLDEPGELAGGLEEGAHHV